MNTAGARRGLLVLRVCAFLVPRYRRREWFDEWAGELEALVRARAEGRGGAYPNTMTFVAGALPHALWMRKEEWTMESVMQDLGYALRVLRRAPGFTLVAALTLALGIGANAAMFSLVNGLLFRPPAGIDQPERLVQIARSYDNAPRWDNWSWPAFQLIADEAPVFSGVAGFSGGAFVLGRGENAEAVVGQYVSGGYFPVLGVRPALGRLLDPSDEVAPGSHPVVVLSHGLWVRRFGSDPAVLGSTVSIGSNPYEIVGVAPADFAGVDAVGSSPELWVSAYQRVDRFGRGPFDQWGSSWFNVFGRLRDGVGYPAAETVMDGITTQLRSAWEEHADIRVLLAPGVGLSPEERAEGRQMGWLLTGIATLVLLLTCANVGNLFLARATERAGEVGVRQALGAGRGRLVRQLITESIALALMAAALAIPLVMLAGGLLPSLLPWTVAVSLAPDVRVFGFMLLVGVLAGFLFGVAPALAVSRRDVAGTLREGGTTGGRRRTRLRDALVVGQLALSLGLVSGAALLGRSVLNARTADPGFDVDNVVVGFLNLSATGRYANEDIAAFDERLVEELRNTPGVAAAALAGQAPILGGHSRSTVVPADRPNDESVRFEAEYTVVTPDYFNTLGIPVLRGRTFREPSQETEPVVVINEALARLYWPGEDAVGKELAGPLRVIGVVGDVQMRSLRSRANPGVYYPYHQNPESYLALHVRTRGPASAAIQAVRRAVANVDPELPLTGATELRQGISRSLAETRTFVAIVTTFAGLALILAVIGLYGLVTHGVSQRAREMGIRVALGAGSGTLHRLILGRAVALSAVGVILGLGVAVALGRALEGVLYGVGAANPLALGGAAGVLLAASLMAAWIPARRASRVDAVVSLRE